MKYVRYRDSRGEITYGVLEEDTVCEISGGLFGAREETGRKDDLGSVELLCPCEPSKILAIGWNYRSHLSDRPAPENPEIFVVPVSALLEPEGTIRIPDDAENVHFEGELVMVVGKKTREIQPSEAEEHIFGFTCGNDISERNWQKNDLQWWRAKGCDTFAPLGPAIVTDFNWKEGQIRTRVNGETVQSGRFAELLFDPPAILSYASRYVTLYPGDVIFTGTPGVTRPLQPGDSVEVEIPGIGVLRNRVA
ncbi:MAG: fumarylacetoacetate hydrolase family protein [Acidobacteria bacterium]|nr:fumarylacetoacetate hydrolase family protein [Acidobacteriota bacterium]